MAAGLRIINEGLTVAVDLHGGVFQVERSWFPEYARDDVQMTESIPGILVGTETQIKNELESIEDSLRKAREFVGDKQNQIAWYLELTTDAGTVQRSLLMDGSVPQINGLFTRPYLADGKLRKAININRHPLWEPASVSLSTQANIGCFGGTWDWSSIKGTDDARISWCSIDGDAGGPIANLWIGFREERRGLTYFSPLMEAEDGIVVDTADTSTQVVSGTSGGSVMRTTFATDATLIERFKVVLEDAVATPAQNDDYIGRYQILARVRLTAASSKVGLQLRTGFKQSTTYINNLEMEVTDTDWRIIPLGSVQLPPYPLWSGYGNDLYKYTFSFWAERLSGAASLEVDAFILMPAKRLLTISGANITTTTGTVEVITREDDFQFAIGHTSGQPDLSITPGFERWGVPVGNSRIVVVGERSGSHDLNDQIGLSMQYASRFRGYLTT